MTTDTGEVKSVQALLDSGATGMFIDRVYVKANRLSTRTLSSTIPVRNVDGTPNEAGLVTEVVLDGDTTSHPNMVRIPESIT